MHVLSEQGFYHQHSISLGKPFLIDTPLLELKINFI